MLVYTSDQNCGKVHRKSAMVFPKPLSLCREGMGEPLRGGGTTLPQDTVSFTFTGFSKVSPQGSAGKGGSSLGTGVT